MLPVFLMMFVISLPILVYHKFSTVLDVVRKPLLFQKPPLYMTYGLLRLLLSWGSIVGILVQCGTNRRSDRSSDLLCCGYVCASVLL